MTLTIFRLHVQGIEIIIWNMWLNGMLVHGRLTVCWVQEVNVRYNGSMGILRITLL